jgi:hypothetical protein
MALNDLNLLHLQEFGGKGDYSETTRWSRQFLRALRSMDAAEVLAGVGLGADEIGLTIDGHLSQNINDAVDRIGVGLPDGALHFYRAAGLMGWTNLVEGTVFEQAVADAANAGRITLPDGADHVELASRTQEGWDLALMRGDKTVGHAQVKFAPDDHTIVMHLHEHPDVPIVIASHEAARDAATHGVSTIDSHIEYGGLHDAVASAIGDRLGASHFVHEWVPEVALAFIAGTAAYRLWWRHESPATVKKWAKEQASAAGAANVAATAGTVVTGIGLLRLPISFTTRTLIRRVQVAERSADRATRLREQLKHMQNHVAAASHQTSP